MTLEEKEKGMPERELCRPSQALAAHIEKGRAEGDDKWTLILVRELRHSPEKVWQALTDPAQLREWAPFVADVSLGTVGTVNLTWVETGRATETKITRADAPKSLEYGDMRWELESHGTGTRLKLWHSIDRRFITWGAAGWHICFDVLDRLLAGEPVGQISGSSAMKIDGWKQLVGEYAKQFGVELPKWVPDKKS